MKFKRKTLNYSSTKSGFTMVELSLTMAFVAVLLITIAVITSNIMTIYQKGLTIKAVNSVGRGLTDEFITGINTAPAVDTTSLCKGDFINQNDAAKVKECKSRHAFKFVYQDRRDSEQRQLNGIFCSGTYSYMWNTYYGLNGPHKSTISLRYLKKDGNIDTINSPRLIRIKDPTYRLCTAKLKTDYTSSYEGVSDSFPETEVLDITRMRNDSSSPENRIDEPEGGMLTAFDLDLELYEFTIFPISQDNMTLRTYMSGTFTLATTKGNIDIIRTGDYCQPDSVVDHVTGEVVSGDTSSINDIGSAFNYCAINKFNFAARTAGVD